MDTLVLAALKERSRFRTLSGVVPSGMLTPETQAMLAWYKCYFDTFPEHEQVDVDALVSLIRLRSAPSSAESVAVTLALAEQLRKPVSEGTMKGILGQLHELDLAGRAGALVARYNNGEEIELAFELNKLSTSIMRSMSQSTPQDYIDTPIGDLLAEVTEDKGIKFRRIALLREHMLGLQGGASLALGARPDKGKTSFIADAITDFAPQCVQFFGADRPILWLNNEGSGKRIIPRIYQAALNKDLNEIISMSNSGALVPAYTEAIGGRADLIRVKDMHGASLAAIEQVIEAMNPCIVIFDMLANFRLGGQPNGSNKADAVEQLWQEVREMAVRHDFIALSTVQVSVEGDNQLFPPYSALKDSKTGIQGATDVIIMLGSLNSADMQNLRGISTPKNKFCPPGKQSYAQGQVDFDAPRSRFTDYAA